MASISSLLRKLRLLIGRRAFHDELAEEMSFHREQAERELQAAGVSPDEARLMARRQFGNSARLKEESLDSVGFRFETIFQDFRYAARQLRKNPGFSVTAILILALGIGATAAIFSAIDPILFEPLPYPDADRIMMIWYAASDGSTVPQAFHTFRELQERNRSLEAIAVMRLWQPTITGSDQPQRFDGQQVSAGYFRALGVAPMLGRDFTPSDDAFHGPNTVILSHGLWQRRFGSDRNLIGQQVKLDDRAYTVIGVMPPGFDNVLAPSAELWSTLQYNPGNIASTESREWGHHLRMVGRVRDGVSIQQARDDLNRIARTPVSDFPRPDFVSMDRGLIVNRLQDDVTRGVRPALLAILGAVLLVLVIACVNVTNLLLARGAQRRGEFSVRAALGAARSRLVRQLVTESLFLAFLGGTFGILAAQLGVRALIALSPPELPRAGAIGLNATVFALAFAMTAVIGVVVGIIPALHISHGELHAGLQASSRRTAGGHQLTRRTLVVAEVALALVLLVSAGLLLHSLRRLFAVPVGFEASHLITMQVQTYGHRYDDDRACHQFFEQALDAVRRVPGVTAASFTSQLPLSGDTDGYGVQFEDDAPGSAYPSYRYSVAPGYFETMQIPLRRGRLLDTHDGADAPPVVVISESLAKLRFPDEDPIGKRVHIGGSSDAPMYTIVGVVGNVKQMSLALSESDAVYTTTTQWHWADGTLSLVARANGDAAALVPQIKKAIWSVDKDQPIIRIASMDHLLEVSAAQRRFVLILFEAFGFVALILAATGIYGVLSGSVTERMREIGVRAALGATPHSILALILRQGMVLTVVGIMMGLVGASAASQALITLLFGVSRLDPLTYFGVITLLMGVSAIACAVPAWRAAQVDPATTLRAD